MTAADPRDGLPELPTPCGPWHSTSDDTGYYTYTADQMRAYAEQCIAHARPEAVDERVVRQVAIAINYAWIGVDGSARQWWAQLGSNERKHKDDVARAAIAAYHEALTPERAP